MQRLTAALDRRSEPLSLFFRDDDAGWGMDTLDAMLAIFARHACPVDLAVIPAALADENADQLNSWIKRHDGIGLHQHGYAHLNYEAEGERKCEFGASRPIERQCADIMIGRTRLASMLATVDPIFTPPWNRCLPETVARLKPMGFHAYSADQAVDCGGNPPLMLPINLDWERALREERLEDALAKLLSASQGRVGVMLHHNVMTNDGIALLDMVLGTIRNHPKLQCLPMRALMEKLP